MSGDSHACSGTSNSSVGSYLYTGRKASAGKLWQTTTVRWGFFILGSFPVMHTPERTLRPVPGGAQDAGYDAGSHQ